MQKMQTREGLSKNDLPAVLQLMDARLTQFPGVEYDGQVLKDKFYGLLRSCQDQMNERVQQSDFRLAARRSKLETAARNGENSSSRTLGSKAQCYGVGYG